MADEEERQSSEQQGGAQPTEEEMRAELEEEIRKVRVEDVVLQSVVSILNLSARRIAKDDERDLAQAKIGIDACRAIVDLLPEEAQGQAGGEPRAVLAAAGDVFPPLGKL